MHKPEIAARIRRRTTAMAMLWSAVVFLLLALIPGVYSNELSCSTPRQVGQWIWSPADERIFLESRGDLPDLVPSIWVSTITAANGTISQKLARSPALGKSIPSVGIVVRIEDSVHQLWDIKDTDDIAHQLDARLHRLLELLAAADVQVGEVQLDYDCPVRRLDSWAKVVRTVGARSLDGKSVWITSLPSHLNVSNYSALFREAARGHILQLFDTGVSCTPETLQTLCGRLSKQDMPFRIGLGAFERHCSGRITDHQLWFSAIPSFSAIPGYQGIWVFPGGTKWLDLGPFRSAF